MSKYHQFPEYSDRVVARYQKAIPCKLSGTRLSPNDDNTRIDFILSSREENFENGAIRFNYKDDVIELYSDKEARMFQAINNRLFEAGSLVPYTDSPAEVKIDNALSQDQIKALAKYGNKAQFAEKLKEFDSWVPVSRVLAELDENAPMWRRDLLLQRLNELKG